MREGQPAFRKRLLQAYEGMCAVTGCSVQVLLEAAHIMPYSGAWHTRAHHGLLLKTDIHTLFDRVLIQIDTDHKIRVSPHLLGYEYELLEGQKMKLPKEKSDWPDAEHLLKHREYWSK